MDLDDATIVRLAAVYPDLRVAAIKVYEDMFRCHQVKMRCSDGLRTQATLEATYAQGRTAPGPIVTYARPEDSLHRYGLALDSCFIGKDPFLAEDPKKDFLWNEYGKFCVAYGLTWGGAFKHLVDLPHAELTYGLNLTEIKNLYAIKGNESVWFKMNQIKGC